MTASIFDRIGRLRHDANGVAAVEFALLAPMLLVILLGTLAYGGYFWIAHSIQQLANDAARTSLAGLTTAERRDIATATVASGLTRFAELSPDRTQVAVEEAGDWLIVRVSYDAAGSPFLNLGFVPLPDSTIRRRAAVVLGGL